MNIVRAKCVPVLGAIPLMGFESVVTALTVYATGGTRDSTKAQQEVSKDLDQAVGPMAGAMFIATPHVLDRRVDATLKGLLNDAKPALQKRGRFEYSFDFEAMGTPFFKTIVNIDVSKTDDQVYFLSLAQAYTGGTTSGLAEALNIEQTLLRVTVEVETEVLPDNRFAFDFEEVLLRLSRVLPVSHLTAQELVAGMMRGGEYDHPSQKLCVLEDLTVWVYPERVEKRTVYERRSAPRDTWALSTGSVLRGELARDYASDEPKAKATPTFHIDVVGSSPKEDDDGRMDNYPMWLKDQRQRAIAVAEVIASVFA